MKDNQDWKKENKQILEDISNLLSVKSFENVIINDEESLNDGKKRLARLSKFLYDKLLKNILNKINSMMFSKDSIKNSIHIITCPLSKSQSEYNQKLKDFKFQNIYSLYEREFLSGKTQFYYNLDLKGLELDDLDILNYSQDTSLQELMLKSTNNLIRNTFFNLNTKFPSKELKEKLEDMIFTYENTEKMFLLDQDLIKTPKYKYQNKFEENLFEKRYTFGKEDIDDVLDQMKEFDDHGKFIYISNEEIMKLEEKRMKNFKPFATMFECALKGNYIRKLTLNYQMIKRVCIFIKTNTDEYMKLKDDPWYQVIQRTRCIDFEEINRQEFLAEKEKLLKELEEIRASKKQSSIDRNNAQSQLNYQNAQNNLRTNELEFLTELQSQVFQKESDIRSLKDLLDSTNKSIEEMKKISEKKSSEIKLAQNKITLEQEEKKKIELEIQKAQIIIFLQNQLKEVEKGKNKKTEK